MGTIPTTPTFVAGTPATAADMNSVCDVIDFWALTPRCSAYASGTQSLTDGTWAVIALAAELYDIVQSGDTASHDTVTNNSRVYIRTTGKYDISGQVQIATSASGLRAAQIRLNAAGAVGSGTLITTSQQSPVSGGSTSVGLVPVEVALTAGDYIEIFGFQSSGGSVSTVAGNGFTFLRHRLVGS